MNPYYWFSHGVIKSIYDSCFRGDVAGLENVPSKGPYLLAANHTSYLDPPFVGVHILNEISFFARKSLWKGGFSSWWLDAVGTIPVDREGGADLAAMKRVFAVFKDGGVVIMFPEGTRSPDGTMQEPKAGIGMLACRAGIPVIPARIFGAYEALGRGGRLRLGTRVSMTYGRPMSPAEYADPSAGKARYERAAQRIMERIATIKPPRLPVV